MSTSSTESDSPTPEPVEVTPKTITINIEPYQDDEPAVVEAESEQLEKRRTQAKIIVDSIIPEANLDDLYRQVAEESGKVVADLDADEKEIAESYLADNQNLRKRLVDEFTDSSVADEDLEKYSQAVVEFAQELATKDTPPDLIFGLRIARSIEQAELFTQFARTYKKRFIDDPTSIESKRKTWKIKSLITDVSGNPPSGRTTSKMDELLQADLELWDYAYNLPTGFDEDTKRNFTSFSEMIGLKWNDGEQTRLAIDLFKQASQRAQGKLLDNFINVSLRYANNHRLSPIAIEGLLTKLLPHLERRDPQVAILAKDGNIWGMRQGDFGVADFLCHAYASPVDSIHLNELMIAAREVPTTNAARLEQNRVDALTLANSFGILRDFIHDQRPYVHELVSRMVKYHETKNRKPLEAILPKIRDYFNSSERIDLLFDLTLYDTPVRQIEKDWGEVKSQKPAIMVKPVDVLRRLVENTEPVEDVPPVTSDAQLNDNLGAVVKSKLAGKNFPETVAEAMDYMTDGLLRMENSHEIGIEPNHIIALTWIAEQGFKVLQKLTYEDQVGVYKKPWFASILKFQEVTATLHGFNPEKFNALITSMKELNHQQAYLLITTHALDNIAELAEHYIAKGQPTGTLMSGNIAHEIVGLTDPRRATTALGKKFVKEEIIRRRNKDLGYHPGD